MSGFFMFLWMIISISFLVTLVITIVNKLRKKEGRITKKTPIILFVAGFLFFILAAMTSPTTSESATNSSSSTSKVNKEKVASSKAKEAAASSRSEQARIKSSEKSSSEAASSKASSEAAQSSIEASQKASSEESASVAQSNSVAESQSRVDSEKAEAVAESQSRVDSEKAEAASVSNAAQQNDTDTTQIYTGTSEQIIGNARSHIYHVPGQAGYHMNSANAVYFNSEAEAQAAGYRKSQR